MKRKFIIAFLALTAFITYNDNAFSTKIDVRPNVELSSDSIFNSVKVAVPSHIKVLKDNEFKIRINAQDEIIRKNIKYDIRGGVLNIWMENIRFDEIDKFDSNNISICISSPNDLIIKPATNLKLVNYHKNKRNEMTSYENN